MSWLFKLSNIKFEMGVFWKDLGFVVQVLRVCVSCAASSNCVLNGLEIFHVGV